MASVGNKIIAYVASPLGGAVTTQSQPLTITVVNLTGFELKIPIYVDHPDSQSNPPEIYFYASNDGGTTYDTLAYTSFSFSRNPGANDKRTITLPGGAWAIKIISGAAPNSFTMSFAVLTIEVLTAYYGS